MGNRKKGYDVGAMVALRMAGEVLVAEEYRHVVPELERRFGLTPEKSRFYAPHFYHDRKEGPEDVDMFSHTGSFESVLARMIHDEGKLEIALASAQRAYEVRTSFYDQFTPEHQARKIVGRTGLALAAAGLLAYVGMSLDPSEREEYAAFLAANPTAAAFYVDADRRLIGEFQRTGNAAYLTNIGTFNAAREVWGDGP